MYTPHLHQTCPSQCPLVLRTWKWGLKGRKEREQERPGLDEERPPNDPWPAAWLCPGMQAGDPEPTLQFMLGDGQQIAPVPTAQWSVPYPTPPPSNIGVTCHPCCM